MITEATNCFNHPQTKTTWACDRCFRPICEIDYKTKGPTSNYQIFCYRCYDTVKYRNIVLGFFIGIFLIGILFGWTTTNFF